MDNPLFERAQAEVLPLPWTHVECYFTRVGRGFNE